jgi:hypothetical protein
LEPADWIRHVREVVPSLRVSVETEVGDPWGPRLSTAIGTTWKLYLLYAGGMTAKKQVQSTVKAVARRVRSGPAAMRRWITGHTR